MSINDDDPTYAQGYYPLTMWEQMEIFHEKYGLEPPEKPIQLPQDVLDFRIAFLEEELAEYKLAVASGDLAEQIDALVDLVVVAMGTAHIAGFRWNAHWNEVYEANMKKTRAKDASESKRKHYLDIVKPEGWKSPNHWQYILKDNCKDCGGLFTMDKLNELGYCEACTQQDLNEEI